MIIEHIDVDEKATCESRLFHNQYTSDRVHDVEVDRRVNSKASSSELTLNFNRLSSRHSNRFDVTDSERAHFNQNNSSINFMCESVQVKCFKCSSLWHLHPAKSINKTNIKLNTPCEKRKIDELVQSSEMTPSLRWRTNDIRSQIRSSAGERDCDEDRHAWAAHRKISVPRCKRF